MGSRDERELEAFLRRRSRLSELYAGLDEESAEPGPATDRAVLAAARQAVEAPVLRSPPRAAPGPFARHWSVPLSLAAAVVLSVTVVVLLRPPDRALDPPSLDPDSALPAPAPDALAPPREAGEARGTGAPGRPAEPLSSPPAPPRPAAPDAPLEPGTGHAFGKREARELAERHAPAPRVRVPADGAGEREETAQATGESGVGARTRAGTTAPGGLHDSLEPAGYREALAHIRSLIDAGRPQEAARAIARLEARYPERSLPEELREFPRKERR